MRTRSWYEISLSRIDAALAEGRAIGLDGAALVSFVDKAYPFGERRMWPYKMWLKARRKRLEFERLIPKKPVERVEWPAPPTPMLPLAD